MIICFPAILLVFHSDLDFDLQPVITITVMQNRAQAILKKRMGMDGTAIAGTRIFDSRPLRVA